jgi:dephospho-CoA kinase
VSKSVYVIGEPGSGKTTVTQAICKDFASGEERQLLGKLWGKELLADNELAGYRLGRDRGLFSGTDALAMSANPDAIQWLEATTLPALIVGEGARLANKKFLTTLNEKTQFLLVLLIADNALERRNERGSNQNPSWVKGRLTASLNLYKEALDLGWNTIIIDNTSSTPEDSAAIIWEALQKL